ncbi:MAG: hypothetical protein WB788_08955 [Thermoplasmata archaeon]
MVTRVRNDLLMFVAGEPGSGENPGWKYVGFLDGSIRQKAGSRPAGDPPPPGALGDEPWHLPPEMIKHVNVVVGVAHGEGRTVTVVDVNRAFEHQDLVRRWVGPNDVLPILVGPDGSRLEGTENFVPQVLRQFMRRS